jgi:HAD superfamily hydrolase (TIGR01509 family)
VPLLLLDLDNTLADREAAFLTWAREKAAEWAPDDPGAVAYLVEQDCDGVRPRSEFLAAAAGHFGVHRPVEELLAGYRRAQLAYLPPLPRAIAHRLRALRSGGWKLAVVTNGEAAAQAAKIERLGLASLVDACCISGALGVRKPDARIFAIAAERCGLPLAGAWMVGDGEADVEGARNAGISSVWLHRGRTWTRSDITPDRTVAGLEEALDTAGGHSPPAA